MADNLNNFDKDVQTDFENPGSLKSGEYLYKHIEKRALLYISHDRRDEVVQVVKKWLSQRNDDTVYLLAIALAKNLLLYEAVPELVKLNHDVLLGSVLKKYYSSEWIIPAIDKLQT